MECQSNYQPGNWVNIISNHIPHNPLYIMSREEKGSIITYLLLDQNFNLVIWHKDNNSRMTEGTISWLNKNVMHLEDIMEVIEPLPETIPNREKIVKKAIKIRENYIKVSEHTKNNFFKPKL